MSAGGCPYGGQWWSCTDQSPSFEGCCSVDPCLGDDSGCPDDDQYPAEFSSVAATSSIIESIFPSSTYLTPILLSSSITTSSLSTSSPSTSNPATTLLSSSTAISSPSTSSSPRSTTRTTLRSSTTSSSLSSSSSSTTALPAGLTSSPTSVPESASPGSLSKKQVHTIIGGAVGGTVLVFTIILVLFLSWHRAKRSRNAHLSQPPLRPTISPFSEMSPNQGSQRSRTPLPHIQTNLSNTPQRQTIHSAYSAYSPNHITPSSFDPTNSSTDHLAGSRGRRASHGSDEVYYPGRPIFGVLHAIQTTEPVAQSRRSTASEFQGPTPPPAYVARQHSPTPQLSHAPSTVAIPSTSTAGPRRASYNFSYPRHNGARTPTSAAVGLVNRERRSIGPHYETRQPPLSMVRRVPIDPSLRHETRRRSEPPPVRHVYETPDSVGERVPELPSQLKTVYPRPITRRPVGARGLKVRTLSGSALDGSRSWIGHARVAQGVESLTFASAPGLGYGSNMRTNRERENDAYKKREREWQQNVRQAVMP